MREDRIEVNQIERIGRQVARRQRRYQTELAPRISLLAQFDCERHAIYPIQVVARHIAHEKAEDPPPSTAKIQHMALGSDGLTKLGCKVFPKSVTFETFAKSHIPG